MPLDHIAPTIHPDLHTIVHFGAGQCRELTAYLAAKPQRIVLVEADPEIAASLKKTAAGAPNVDVRQAAVAGEGGDRKLYIYNLRDTTSLRPATGIRAIFPGLRLIKELPVETLTSDSLLSDLELNPEQNNWLAVDVPGEEQEIIEGLANTNTLHSFKTINLSCGRQALYEGSHQADAVLALLDDYGYEIIQYSDETDPDRPSWKLTRSAMALEAKLLKEQVADLRKDRDEQAKLAVDRQGRIKELESALAEYESRQGLLDDEMLRVEGQIELINEILQRKNGL